MLWKRATPAGAFVGFLTAILVSMGMWVYVHTFPDGYRPQPRVGSRSGSRGTGREDDLAGARQISRVIVEKGTVQTTNIPLHEDGKPAGTGASMTIERETTLPPRVQRQGRAPFGLLAPDVVLAGTNQPDKFGVEGVPVVLKPGVKVEAVEVQQTFNPAEFNPDHTKYIARSAKAKPMAVNMYSGFWTLIVCVVGPRSA